MNYEFHPEAETELLDAAAYCESEVPGLGARFADEVERVVELLLERPELGARVYGDIRHFVLDRFPFSVIYAVG
jgi:plasmid stabilization system protein ParE